MNASTVALRRQTLNLCWIKESAHPEMTRPRIVLNNERPGRTIAEQAISQDRWVQTDPAVLDI